MSAKLPSVSDRATGCNAHLWGLQGFCPLGPHLTRLRVQLFFLFLLSELVTTLLFFSSLPSLRAVRRILPPCLWLLHICVSSVSVLPCTLTVCPFVCLLYKPCFSSPPFTRIQFFFKSCFFFPFPSRFTPSSLSLPYHPCSGACPWPLAFEINDSGPLAGFWKALRVFLPTPQVLLCP